MDSSDLMSDQVNYETVQTTDFVPFKEESLPLITFNNETQKFEVNQEVKMMLSNLKGPIGVVAVAGQYRTGKSYLLNRMLLNRSKGFGVGPTINPCTKGLWIWGTPISGTTQDGQHIQVLVVDSEGIGGLDEDNNHDMRIFSLALLLSSYFLYNSVGSIDENALSNLSLVTNISKHIQFKSAQNSSDDGELDDLINCMPSFMWVVRDFALQLCDEEGNDIDPKEYFERALQEKGQMDSKNEIRKHLKQFFKNRECCTIIRPLTNEEELQNLETMDLEELRAEFVEQVMQLRMKVLHKIKPKTIQNQAVDGSQWIQMVELYVDAMNNGSVPNIQSSWSYICRQNAQKSLDKITSDFEQELQLLTFPMNHDDLLHYFLEQKQAFLNKLTSLLQNCEPEIKQDTLKSLESYLTTKEQETLTRNIYECRQYAADLLTQIFSEFDSQLKQHPLNEAFNSFIEATMTQVTQVYDQNLVDFPEKNVLLAEAKGQFLMDTLAYVQLKMRNDSEQQRLSDIQVRERLEQQILEFKDSNKDQLTNLESRLKQALLEKSDFETQLILLKEQFSSYKQNRESEDQETRDQLRKVKDEAQYQVDMYRQQKDEFEEKVVQIQRHLIQVESEFEKERALFEQKIEFLEKSLEEKQAREREYQAERQSQKQGISSEIKALCLKYEQDLKSLQAELKEEQEKYQELETTLKEKESLFTEKEQQWQSQEQQLRQNLQVSQDQLKTLETSLGMLRKETESKLSSQTKEKDGKVEMYIIQIQEMETLVRESSEKLKQNEHEFKKERAIKDQKIEFLEMQLQDCKDQLEESHKQHEQMVRAMKADMHEDDSQKRKNISPSKMEALQGELHRIQEENEQLIKSLQEQVEHQVEKSNDLELQLRLQQSDNERLQQQYQSQIFDLDNQRAMLNDKVKVLESQKARIIEEQEQKYKSKISEIEEEMEFKNLQSQQEIKDIQEKSEEALAQLRNFYEIEKEKLEQRIQEERDKNQRRLQNFQEEFELRVRDEMQEKDDEIECLQNELRENEARHQAYVTQMEHELSLKQQMMETMETQAQDMKQRIQMLEYGKNTAFEKQIEHFEIQRQEYNAKIDKLLAENLDKDRQLAQIQHKMERLQDEMERKRQEIDGYKDGIEREKKTLLDKMDNQKRKLTEAQDEAMKQKLEFGREQALMKQQIEFQQRKIDELQKTCDDSSHNFDDKLKLIKSEIQDEAQAQIERITSEKELWENKYEQKRRALKEIEMSLSKSNNELEKKIIMMQSQVDRVEEEKRLIEEQYQDEIQNLTQQIQHLDSSAGAAYYYGSAHAEDVLKMKQQVQDLERELSDLQSTYDRDKALWEGKCQFLETQKETYKRDLIESQKKFEITLEQLQKRGNMDKDKFETNQQSLLKVIETKYKTQIKEMLDTHQQLQSEAQSKIKRQEQEIKTLNEKLQLEARGKISDYASLEKKCTELTEAEKRIQQELEDVKAERDRRIQEYQRQMDKDKEIYRQKLADYEQKAKDSESRRASLMFEYEKERARWQLERDGLLSQKAEMMETIEKLQQRKDFLLRENEKLKNESKGSRKYLLGNATNMQPQSMTSHSSTSATRYMVGKSISSSVAGNVITQAMNKMKENKQAGPTYLHQQNNYQGYQMGQNMMMGQQNTDEGNNGNMNTTPNSKKYNRYGN